jgi:hypothetical protein
MEPLPPTSPALPPVKLPNMKLIILLIAGTVGLLALLEGLLRLGWGFGKPLLYIADDQIGYLLAPNQQVRRFGNRIEINADSMRSAPVSPQLGAWRLLLLGDSVANGGWWTDQSQTISELLGQQLRSDSNSRRSPGSNSGSNSGANSGPAPTLEVLNASANSWGPRNELAYLRRFGSFDARVIVLLINTDDLFATAPSSLVVGQDRNYPDRPPASAIHELLQRYLLPEPPLAADLKAKLQALAAEPGDRVGINLAAIQSMHEFAQQHQAQLLVLLTPLLREVGTGSRDYEVTARRRLQDFTQATSLDYIDCLPIFNQVQEPGRLYRDHIHLSPIGNQRLSELVYQWVAKMPLTR